MYRGSRLFVCVLICVDLLCSLLVNAHVSFEIDQTYILCYVDFPKNLRLYFWKHTKKLGILTKKST